MFSTSFILEPVQPFRLDYTVWALRRREKNQIDYWDGKTYTRVVLIDSHPVMIQVTQPDQTGDLHVQAFHYRDIHIQDQVAELLTKMLGLNIDLQFFYELSETNPYLNSLVQKFKGVKPPRFPTFFEGLANAVACQQVSLESGLSLLNNLTHSYGQPFNLVDGVRHAFPEPEALVNHEPADFRKLGFSQSKSWALHGVAVDILENKDFYEGLESHARDEIFIHLSDLKGIGRWSVEYAMLRGLGRIDILPGDDIAVTKSLKSILQLDEIPDYNKMKELEVSLYPYGGMIYFHLILNKLEEKGFITVTL